MSRLFQPEADDTLPETSLHVVCSKGKATKGKALRQPESALNNCVVPTSALVSGVRCARVQLLKAIAYAHKWASLDIVRLKCIFKSVLNQDLRVLLGGNFFSKALCRAVSSYHMNNQDVGLLELEMPSSFSYAGESFHWNLSSPDISLLLCFSTTVFSSSNSNTLATAVATQGFHIGTWILPHLGWGCHKVNNWLHLQ